MTKKRDKLQVIYDMLKIIRDHRNEIKPTPLLRYSNLSSQRFTEYMKGLKERALIQEKVDKKGRKHISLTDQGFNYLEKYKMILGFIDDFNL